MVAAPDTRVGLDLGDKRCHLARVTLRTGRPEIMALASVAPEQLAGHDLLDNSRIIHSVHDDLVTVKKINLGDVAPDLVDSAARFELAQSLLEDEMKFCFDIVPTGPENRFLGTITRRERADQQFTAVLPDHSRSGAIDQENLAPLCRARAVALGMGYLSFCHRDAGELICLADFTDRLISVCFVHHDNIVGLDRLKIDSFDLTTDTDIGRMAVEFKTLVNFKLTSLFDNGVTVPLAALLINRDTQSDIGMALKTYFPDIVGAPRINPGFFAEPSTAGSLPLPDYLVALGLTVK